jgi:hypothetical protein
MRVKKGASADHTVPYTLDIMNKLLNLNSFG